MKSQSVRKLLLLLPLVAFLGCPPVPLYNQQAYDKAVSLKVDALNLMDMATTPYDSCQAQIQAIKTEYSKAYEYSKGLPDNEESIKQYEVIGDPNGGSLMGFIERWKSQGKLGKTFVDNVKGVFSDQMDQIIGLEGGKKK